MSSNHSTCVGMMTSKSKIAYGTSVILLLLAGIPSLQAEWFWSNPYLPYTDCNGIWGTSNQNIFVVGDFGYIFHFNGTQWSVMDSGTNKTLNDIWGCRSDHIIAVGAKGTILLWNGNQWKPFPADLNGNLHEIWGVSENDFYVIRKDSVQDYVYHWNGVSFSEVPIPGNEVLYAVWGLNSDDVYIGGNVNSEIPALYHWNGSTWTSMPPPPEATSILAIWGTSAQNIYVSTWNTIIGFIYRWDGSEWHVEYEGSILQGFDTIFGTSATDVYSASNYGDFLHWDGSTWTSRLIGSGEYTEEIWGNAFQDVYAVGPHSIIMHIKNLDATYELTATDNDLHAFWSNSSDPMFAVGDKNSFIYWDGSSWTIIPVPAIDQNTNWNDIWCDGAKDVFLAGDDFGHWNGSEWNFIEGDTSDCFQSVWGFNADNVIVVRSDGSILRWNGTETELIDINPDYSFSSVWGASPNRIFIAGKNSHTESGVIIDYDGTNWKEYSIPPVGPLTDIHGLNSSDVMAVGDSGVILHWDGFVWRQMYSTIDLDLNGIWMIHPDEVLACGKVEIVLRYDGWNWEKLNAYSGYSIYGIRGNSLENFLVCGANGIIRQWKGSMDPQPGAVLKVNRLNVHSNDDFQAQVRVTGKNSTGMNARVFVALDLGTGDYWFWPGWTKWPPDFEYMELSLERGENKIMDVFNFIWPVTDSEDIITIQLISFMTDDEFELIGDIDIESIEFQDID